MYFTVVAYLVSFFTVISFLSSSSSLHFFPSGFPVGFEKHQCSLLVHSLGLSTFYHMENMQSDPLLTVIYSWAKKACAWSFFTLYYVQSACHGLNDKHRVCRGCSDN